MAEDIEIRINTTIDTADSATKIQDIKKSMRELKSLALEVGDTNSEQYQRINKALGGLNDKVGDLNASIKAMSGEPIENLAKSFKGLRENLMSGDFKTAKVMFNNMKSSVVTLGKSLLGVEEGANLASIGIKGIGKAIALTGIGALVIAVVLLISNFDKLKESGGALGKVFTAIGGVIDFVIQKFKDFSDWIGLTDFKTKEFAESQKKNNEEVAKNAEEWLDRNGDKYDEFTQRKFKADVEYKKAKSELDSDETKSEAQKQQILAELQQKRTREILKADEDRIKKQKEASDKAYQKSEEERKKRLDKKKQDDERKKQDDEKEIKRQQDLAKELMINANALETWRVQQQEDSLQKRLLLFDLQSEKEEEQLRKIGVEDKEITEWRNKQVADIKKKWYEEQNKLSEDAAKERKSIEDKEIQENKDKYQLILSIQADSADKAKKQWMLDNADKIKKLKEAGVSEVEIRKWVSSELNKIDEDYAVKSQTRLEKWQDKVKGTLDKASKWLQTFSELANGIAQIMSDVSQTRINNEEKRKDAVIAGLEEQKEKGIISEQQYAEAKYQIELKSYKREHELRKKAFKQQKAMQIVQAVIGTAQGVVAALSEPFFPLMIARMAMSAATGAAQIAVIASQKMPDDGGPPSAPSTATPNMPNLSTPDTQQQNVPQAPNFFGLGQNNLLTGGGSDQRVFVVESDISATQGRVAKIRDRSTLGN